MMRTSAVQPWMRETRVGPSIPLSNPLSNTGLANLMPSPALLEVHDLVTEFETDEGLVRALDGVSFSLDAGQTLGLVGESGCGKSVTALSIMGLLPRPAGKIASGQILFGGSDLVTLPANAMQSIRGQSIGMVFQEPMTALNPVQTIGRQLTESLELHTDLTDQARIKKAIAMLDRVGIPAPDIRMAEYPHQLSGGMRQRWSSPWRSSASLIC